METTELNSRQTPTGNGSTPRVARKRFDPTQLFAQRDRLPWFWFFVAVVVTVLAAAVVVPRILTWLNAQFKDGAQHALQVGTSIAEIKNQRVYATARRSALDLPSLNRPSAPPLQAVAREALPMPRIQVLDED